MRKALLFISYRRDDTGPYAIALRSELELRLDGNAAFLDVAGIREGGTFEAAIADAIAKARVVLIVIGVEWLGPQDTRGDFRIDDPTDWVRREVSEALRGPDRTVIPVLVNNAPMPEASRLPEDVRKICGLQAARIRAETWTADVIALCSRLALEPDVALRGARDFYPKPNKIKRLVAPLGDAGLANAERDALLPGWDVVTRTDITHAGLVRETLEKRFHFASDVAAYAFLSSIADLAVAAKHHPELMSKFRDVEVRLTTWDAGHRITVYDLDLARKIDAASALLRG